MAEVAPYPFITEGTMIINKLLIHTLFKRIQLKYIENKFASLLSPWQGKSFNIVGRIVLAKSVLT
jgi:hypothetical protein